MISPRLRGKMGTLVIVSAVCLLLFWDIGLAAEEAHNAGGDGGKTVDLLARFINFVLLVVILFVAVKKTALKDFFAQRREQIRKKLEELRSEREEAEKRKLELEEKLRDFEAKKQEIIEKFKADGARERDRIIAEAHERANQLIEQADTAVEREVQAAKDRLRQQVVEMAAKKAEEIIASAIDDKDQKRLVNDFIGKVEKLN